MDSLLEAISSTFYKNPAPKTDVVIWDGYDQLDKETAVEFYAGKSWRMVLKELKKYANPNRNYKTLGSPFYLDEWCVLEDSALIYYSRAHLEFLIHYVQTSHCHDADTYPLKFFHSLYQVFYMRKANPFNKKQTLLLERVAQFTLEKIQGIVLDNPDMENTDLDQIIDSIEQYRSELSKYFGQ